MYNNLIYLLTNMSGSNISLLGPSSVTGSLSLSGSSTVLTLTGTASLQHVTPTANGIYSLGTSGLQWSNVYATTFNGTAFSGSLNGTSSWATNALTSSWAINTLTASNITPAITSDAINRVMISNGNGTLNTNGNSSGTGTTTSSTGINFNNLSISNNVAATITSNLCIVGSYLASTSGVGGAVNVTGPYSIYAQGDLSGTSTSSGTAPIILNGTGTWSGLGFSMPVSINTVGIITIGNITWFGTTLTYIAGSTICTGLVSINGTTTLDTKGSDVPTCGTSSTSGINFYNLTVGGGGTLTNNSNLRVTGTFIPAAPGTNGTYNGSNIYVSGNFQPTGATTAGTALIILDGTGTLSSGTGVVSINITINTVGTITIGSTFIFTGTTITYISGKVNAKNSTVTLTNATLINCHKINFDTVIITSASTVTMNEFFNGSPNLPVKVQASSATTINIVLSGASLSGSPTPTLTTILF